MWKEGDDTYPVGFAKPPRETQFRKGQSGNPRGRPRKAPPVQAENLTESKLETYLRKILNRKFTVTDGSGQRAISGVEALLQAQFQSAMKGNPHAQRAFLQATAELERRDEARKLRKEQEAREHFELIKRWRSILIKKWEEAEKLGNEPDDPWPHPEDILINEREQTYRIRGPINEGMVPYYDYLLTLRDRYLCETSLILRQKGSPDLRLFEIYRCAAKLHDVQLPLAWQLGADAERITLSIEMLTMRKLRALIAKLDQDALRFHMMAFPQGERIKLDPDLRRILKPIIGRFGFRSIAQYERHLEQESGNPPRPLLLGT